MLAWVAVVTLLAVLFYAFTGISVARARTRYGVAAPAMTGNPDFERYVRVEGNTLEQLVIFLPALWLFAIYVEPRVAAGLGVVWIVGRVIYMAGYIKAAEKRGPGFRIQAVASVILLIGALIGAGMRLVGGG
jgi:glutathione S-transferase